jgi:hypothetical protein
MLLCNGSSKLINCIGMNVLPFTAAKKSLNYFLAVFYLDPSLT